MFRLFPVLLLLLSTTGMQAQHMHHYVAAVEGLVNHTQQRELIHFLHVKDPNGRYTVDPATGDVNIHTSTRLREQDLGQAVGSIGLILLHFREVVPAGSPKRRRNQRSA